MTEDERNEHPREGHQSWIAEALSRMGERLAKLEAQMSPLQMLVYGLVGIVMTSVIVALVALVLRK